jgi:small redox-active disulfide protein 2
MNKRDREEEMTLTIKILGPGCPNCHKVEENAVEALETLSEEMPDLEATVHHVTDVDEIMAYDVLGTPGLVVNETVVCAGRIPEVDEVVGWLQETAHGQAG